MTAYQIKDWGKQRGRHRLFEVSQSARYGNPSWFPFPINFEGEHYQMLMLSDDGERAYGIFASLCSLAATTPIRGLLADESGSYSFRKIGAKTRMRPASIEWGITYLMNPEIAWIEAISDVAAARRIRKLSRSGLGVISETEQAAEQAKEQAAEQETEREKEQASAGADSSVAGISLAARQTPPFDIVRVLRVWWPRGEKACQLAALPGATPARVCWLADRVKRERPPRPQGFVEKGIRDSWTVPTEWQTRFAAATGQLRIGGAA